MKSHTLGGVLCTSTFTYSNTYVSHLPYKRGTYIHVHAFMVWGMCVTYMYMFIATQYQGTALHYANEDDLMRVLLERGADPNKHDWVCKSCTCQYTLFRREAFVHCTCTPVADPGGGPGGPGPPFFLR